MSKIRIRDDCTGTYMRAIAAIWPRFGASWKEAIVFADGWEAYELMKRFPLGVLASMVNEKRQKCGVDGKALVPKKPRKTRRSKKK